MPFRPAPTPWPPAPPPPPRRWPAALGGHSVAVCGSFSGWEPVELHQATPGGDFVRSLALPPGPAYFKYLVDGEWICSPTEQAVANGKGYNNHRRALGVEGWAGLPA